MRTTILFALLALLILVASCTGTTTQQPFYETNEKAAAEMNAPGDIIAKYYLDWESKMVFICYLNDGKNYIKTIYADGTVSTDEMTVTKDGLEKWMETAGNMQGEYYKRTDANLFLYNKEDKCFATANKI